VATRNTAWWVYLVRCADGTLYAGCTPDVAARVEKHNLGKGARYTRSRRPVVLVWKRRCADKVAALRREYALKQLDRAQKLSLIATARARKLRSRRRP
jgi:predicted GIY-YIG superfamily endonuclease